METEEFTLADTPWYYGAYLNMARHNIFLLNKHLEEKYPHFNPFKDFKHSKKFQDDRCIDEPEVFLNAVFNTDETSSFLNKPYSTYRYLVKRHYLSLLRVFHEERGIDLDNNQKVAYNKLSSFLTTAFRVINQFRNLFSHAFNTDKNVNTFNDAKDTSLWLDIKSLEAHTIFVDTLETLFSAAREYTKERYPAFAQIDDRYLEGTTYKLFEENNQHFSENGFRFFISLFLENQYAIPFLQKFRGFKNTQGDFLYTLKVFTAYSLKLPDVRLDNHDPKHTLLLTMLNELRKCPSALYNNLSEENKKQFHPELTDESIRNLLENSLVNEKGYEAAMALEKIIPLIRKKERFTYFALRYLEETNALPQLSFQIALGGLLLKKYEKEIVGIKDTRHILKNIKAFGKLSYFENLTAQDVLNELPDRDTAWQFQTYAPTYHIADNKIGFYLHNNQQSKYPTIKQQRPNQPTGYISIHALPKLVLHTMLNDNDTIQQCIKDFINEYKKFLDINTLNALKKELVYTPETFTRRIIKEKKLLTKKGKVFLNESRKQDFLKKYKLTEETLQQNYKAVKNREWNSFNDKEKEYAAQINYHYLLTERKTKLNTALKTSGYTITVNQLPTRIVHYLTETVAPSITTQIHQKIARICNDLKQRSKKVETVKQGAIARYLTENIIELIIDKSVKQRISSVHANLIQRYLALYESGNNKQQLLAILTTLKLFDLEKGHPFLTRETIEKQATLVEFYACYLKKQKNWITTSFLKKGKKGGYSLRDNKIPYKWLKLKRKMEQNDMITWIANKKSFAVELPNTLFNELDSSTFNNFKKKYNNLLVDKTVAFEATDHYTNWLNNLLGTQSFYRINRHYTIDKKTHCIAIDEIDKGAKELSKKYNRYVIKNEKKIRYTQTKDRITLVMCYKLLTETTNFTSENFNLAEITPKENPLLNAPINIKHKVKRWEIEVKNYGELQENEGYKWTIKDFGRIKRILADRRLKELLTYFETKSIPLEFIEYQLKQYDTYRPLIFKYLYYFEKAIAAVYKEDLLTQKREKGEKHNGIEFTIFTEILLKNSNEDVAEALSVIKKIRDKFSHSQFPKNITASIPDATIKTFIKEQLETPNSSEKQQITDLYCSLTKNIFNELKDTMIMILDSIQDSKNEAFYSYKSKIQEEKTSSKYHYNTQDQLIT